MKNNKILSEADYIAKEHYKMYKAGKKWMVAGITAVSILGAVAMAEGTASADQVANTTSGTDPAVVKVDEAAATSQSATTVTLSASASVSSAASEVPAVTEVSASSEVVSSVVASEAVSSSSDVESSVAPASVSASVEASSSVSASVTPIASVSASVESSTVVESSSVVESVASSVAPVVNGHDSVAMSSMMSSAESAKAAGSIVAMRAVLADVPTSSLKTAGTIATLSDADNKIGGYAKVTENAKSTANDPHYLSVTEGNIQSYFSANGTAVQSAVLTASDAKKIASSLSSVADVKMSGVSSSQASMLKSEASYYSSLAATGGNRVYYTLTNGATQQGAVAFNKKVDMTKQWTINFDLNMTTISTPGDFIGLVLMDTDPNKLGTSTIKDDKGAVQTGSKTPGGALGVNGNANAFLWGIDTWKNNESGFGDLTQATANDWMIGFRHTNGNGSLVAATTADQRIINASSAVASLAGTQWSTGDAKGQFSYVAGTTTTGFIIRDTIASNAQSDVTPQIVMGFTAKFTPNGDGTGTLTVYDSQGRVVSSGTVGTVNVMTMALGFKAATGGNYSQMGVTITQPDTSSDDNSNAFNLTVGTRTVPVDYKTPSDSDISELADGTILANLGDVITINPEASETTSEEINAFDKTNDIKTGTPTIPGYKLLSVNDQSGDDISGKTITITDATKVSLTYAKQVQDTFNFVDAQGNTVPVDGQDTYVAGNETDGSSYDSLTYADAQKAGVTGVATIATLLTSLSSRGFSAFAIYDAKGNKVDFSSLKFGGSDAVYKVVLTPDTQSTTIHYIDANGKEISKVVNATAKVGSTLTPALVKSGYVYNSTTTKANAKNAGLAVDSAANYVVTKGVSDVYYTYNSYGVVLNVQKAGGKTVNMMGDGKAIPVAEKNRQQAIDLANAAAAATAPYGMEAAGAGTIADAAKALTDLTKTDATAEQIADATNALTKAVADASAVRAKSVNDAAQMVVPVNLSDQAADETSDVAAKKAALQDALDKAANNAGTSADIDAAKTALATAIADAKTKLQENKDKANATTAPTNMTDNDVVNDALTALKKVATDPNATQTALNKAQDAYTNAVTDEQDKLQTAKNAAKSVEAPKNMTDNTVVAGKLADLKKVAEDGDATATELANAQQAYDDAVKAEQGKLQDAKNAAADVTVPKNVSDNKTVTDLLTALHDTAADGNATASALTAAQKAYDNAVTEAQSALATKKSTADKTTIDTNISDDKATQDALANLKKIAEDKNATASDLQKAQDAYDKAVTDAQGVLNDGKETAQKSINSLDIPEAEGIRADPSVAEAEADLKAKLKDDNATATDIANAQNKLDQAVKVANKAIDDAKKALAATPVDTKTVKNESSVAAAQKALDDLMASQYTSLAQLNAAQETLQNAVDAAKAKRAVANNGANDAIANVPANVAGDATVKAAQANLQALVDAAAKDGQVADKNALTADILKATTALQSAVTAANSTLSESTDAAKSALNKVPTNVQDDADVQKQEAALNDVLSNPDSSKEEIDKAKSALDTAVTGAQSKLADAKDQAKQEVKTANDNKAWQDNVAVANATDALQNLIDSETATKTDIDNAIASLKSAEQAADNKLADVTATAKSALGKTAPVSGEKAVVDAAKDLQTLLDSGTATATQIADATKKLTDTVSAETTTRGKAVNDAASDVVPANVQDVKTVQDLQDKLQDALANAADDKGTTQAIKDAQKALDDAVKQAQSDLADVKNTAMSDMTNVPVNLLDDKSVTDAKAALNDAINSATATATDVKVAQQVLDDAVTAAKSAQEGAAATANTAVTGVPTSVKDSDAVKDAIAKVQGLTKYLTADTATKSAIDQAKQELAAAVAAQQGVRSDVVTAAKSALDATAPVSG
ncbi:KxYKxGKxW signal peptide domain-containing protein [Weissella cibaria]